MFLGEVFRAHLLAALLDQRFRRGGPVYVIRKKDGRQYNLCGEVVPTMPIDSYAKYSKNRNGLEAEPEERLMPRTLQEVLDEVERDIQRYREFDDAEKARFDREYYLWTAEDRIEWQETQADNAQRIQELLERRDALRSRLC
ncbi:hypothetical protein [Bradyrhizobium sp. RDT46]|uniref:hypothetical protein n=1 Tax=Bradyrhizobium sp. RDT46 TaxID=3341829 RepID=UPI0035C67C68